MAALFISDLHLSAERPAMTELFLAFLRHRVRGGELYILGDLFEAWLGDDAVLPDQRVVLEALQALPARGVTVFFMQGNRDFLAGTGFAAHTGCRLLPDPSCIELGGETVLLMHGDTLCTDDRDYQAYRAQVRHPEFQRRILALSLPERLAMAERYRSESARLSRDKPAAIMDVNQTAVEEAMRSHGVTRLIHGHTHRPAVHRFDLDGRPAERIVLGDWYRDGSVLIYADGRYRVERFDADTVASPTAAAP